MRRGEKKTEIIVGLQAIRRKIFDLVYRLPSEKRGKVFLGEWTVRDLLAHLEGWDHRNIKGVREVLSGKLPSYFSYYDPDWKRFNAMLVKRYKKKDFDKLQTSLQQSHKSLMNFLRGVPSEEYTKDHGLRWHKYKVTIYGDLQTELEDEKTHYRQLRKWLGNSGKTKLPRLPNRF